jgi:hypothetical protein
MEEICYRCDAKNDMYATICKNCGYDLYEDIKIMSKTNKKSKAPLLYLIFGLILPVIAVSIYFSGLYGYLYGFENYNSEAFLKQYLELIKSDDYDKIMKYNGINTDKFNTEKEFSVYINREYGEKHDSTVIAKESSRTTENEEFYKVQFSGNKIKQFKLIKTGEKKLHYFNVWKVDSPETNIYAESVKIFAPVGVDVYVNDVLVDKEYQSTKEKILPHYQGIKDENYKHPRLAYYEVNNLMSISSVYAKKKDGRLCDIVLNDGVYEVASSIPSADLVELKQFAERFAIQYAEFIAMDAKFSDLSKSIYKDTEFYDTLKEFYNGWFPEHDRHGYENLEIGKDIWYDDNHASMQVKFNYFVTNPKYKRKDYPVAYEIYFVKIEGKWLVANVKNI